MAKSVIVTIPTPCHEKWSEMTPADRGRFCAACQKTVRDFTFATDSEIAGAVHSNKNLCGRFTSSQLNRKLYPKQSALKPYAVAAGIAALLGTGGYEAKAQDSVKIEQTENSEQNRSILENSVVITGVVKDAENLPAPNLEVLNRRTGEVAMTDYDGKYSIPASLGDILQFSCKGMVTQDVNVRNLTRINITMADDNDRDNYVTVVLGMIGPQRTFFGRIFYRIGNWFR